MPTSYSHRNGERIPPTVPGAYWFIGSLNGRVWNYMLVCDGDGLFCKIDDEYPITASDCDGQWWGPVAFPRAEEIELRNG